MHSMMFAQSDSDHLKAHFSGCVPIVKWQMTTFNHYDTSIIRYFTSFGGPGDWGSETVRLVGQVWYWLPGGLTEDGEAEIRTQPNCWNWSLAWHDYIRLTGVVIWSWMSYVLQKKNPDKKLCNSGWCSTLLPQFLHLQRQEVLLNSSILSNILHY